MSTPPQISGGQNLAATPPQPEVGVPRPKVANTIVAPTPGADLPGPATVLPSTGAVTRRPGGTVGSVTAAPVGGISMPGITSAPQVPDPTQPFHTSLN